MENIYVKNINELLNSNEEVALINVLSREAFEQEHIPGSINIPFEDPDQFVPEVKKHFPNKTDKIIVYCASEACSASDKAAEALDEAGFSSILHFPGGLKAWKEAGEQVDSEK